MASTAGKALGKLAASLNVTLGDRDGEGSTLYVLGDGGNARRYTRWLKEIGAWRDGVAVVADTNDLTGRIFDAIYINALDITSEQRSAIRTRLKPGGEWRDYSRGWWTRDAVGRVVDGSGVWPRDHDKDPTVARGA